VDYERDEEISSLEKVLRSEENSNEELKARIRVLEEALEVSGWAVAVDHHAITTKD